MKDLEHWDKDLRFYAFDHWGGLEAGITQAALTKEGLEKEELEAST